MAWARTDREDSIGCWMSRSVIGFGHGDSRDYAGFALFAARGESAGVRGDPLLRHAVLNEASVQLVQVLDLDERIARRKPAADATQWIKFDLDQHAVRTHRVFARLEHNVKHQHVRVERRRRGVWATPDAMGSTILRSWPLV